MTAPLNYQQRIERERHIALLKQLIRANNTIVIPRRVVPVARLSVRSRIVGAVNRLWLKIRRII